MGDVSARARRDSRFQGVDARDERGHDESNIASIGMSANEKAGPRRTCRRGTPVRAWRGL